MFIIFSNDSVYVSADIPSFSVGLSSKQGKKICRKSQLFDNIVCVSQEELSIVQKIDLLGSLRKIFGADLASIGTLAQFSHKTNL